MDPLTQLLLQRAQLQAPAQVPVVPPSGGTTHTPPQAKRFANAQAMMQGYRDGWNPNPILLQASQR